MKQITVWTRFNPDKQIWSHNHIEDGHIGDISNQKLKPIGTTEQTANWIKGEWSHHHTYLNDGKVLPI